LNALYQAPKTKTEQTATIDHLAALKFYNELMEEVTARAGSIPQLAACWALMPLIVPVIVKNCSKPL
jgi:hypothetical protein